MITPDMERRADSIAVNHPDVHRLVERLNNGDALICKKLAELSETKTVIADRTRQGKDTMIESAAMTTINADLNRLEKFWIDLLREYQGTVDTQRIKALEREVEP